MNRKRISFQTEKTTNHATYIMSSTFRILDNHSLYYIMKNYDSFDVVIFKQKEGKRQDEFFEVFIKDLKSKLELLCTVTVINDYESIPLYNDIVLDQGYLKEELKLSTYISVNLNHGYTIIESNVVVPVTVTSNKEEYSARTIRPKIHKWLSDYIDPVLENEIISEYEKKAIEQFIKFTKTTLGNYHLNNHPELNHTSNMSVYLKYGIISPVRILLLLESVKSTNKDKYIEELVIRRELSYNFVYYNKNYDEFDSITYLWAYQTMDVHLYDPKEFIYSIEDYINFKTHDPYFNTAMKEMVILGKMHGYMRMYWCKKIIEWSPNYQTAYETAIFLNNKYFLDGNTPNGYTGVAWCFGKHDRAWTERLIFGKLRYMNSNGLKRKFDIDKYIERIEKEVTT